MPNHLNKRTNLPKKAATKLLQKAIWKSRIVVSVRYQLLSSSRMNRHKQKTSSHIFAFNRNLCWFFGCFFFSVISMSHLKLCKIFFFLLVCAKIFCHISHLFRVYDANKASQPANKQRKTEQKNEAIKMVVYKYFR